MCKKNPFAQFDTQSCPLSNVSAPALIQGPAAVIDKSSAEIWNVCHLWLELYCQGQFSYQIF